MKTRIRRIRNMRPLTRYQEKGETQMSTRTALLGRLVVAALAVMTPAAVVGAAVLSASPVGASLPSGGGSGENDTLFAGQGLAPGQSLTSANGVFTLDMQTDGNLVLYMAGYAAWSIGQFIGWHMIPGSQAVMQYDGNLVVYAPGPCCHAVWASNTGGHASSLFRLVDQSDGNLVIYDQNNHYLWASGTSTTELRNMVGVRCLDANAATIGSNGTQVMLYDCWGGGNQNWLINSNGTIQNQQSGRCLDADMNTISTNGTIVHLWDCNGGLNQRWTINSNGTIQNQYSGRCLDADTWTINSNGTKMQLMDCNGGRNQSWYQKPAYSVASSSTFQYCVPPVSPAGSYGGTALKPTPCLNVAYVYDGTTSAVRSVQVSGCLNTFAPFESMACNVTGTWNDLSGNAYATMDLFWSGSVPIVNPFNGGSEVILSTEDDGLTLSVSTSASGQHSGSLNQVVKSSDSTAY